MSFLHCLGGLFTQTRPAAFAQGRTATAQQNSMTNNEEELYQDHVLDHYEDPYHRGDCEGATHAHEDDNPLCGDVVRIELQLDEEQKIKDVWFDGDGCCISQASASMLIEQMN